MIKELRSLVTGSESVAGNAILECRNCGMDVGGTDEVCPACGTNDVVVYQI